MTYKPNPLRPDLKPEPRPKKTPKRIKQVSDKRKAQTKINIQANEAQERKHLIAECDRVFSLYIRAKFYNDGLCYICGVKGSEVNPIQNGHLISRSSLILRWVEDNCRPCCKECNEFKGGNLAEFGKKLMEEIGETRFIYLHNKKRNTYKINNNELAELISQFSKELTQLK
jgi:5-methylcytosine-specific restriction endonuclease McrA